MIFAKKPEPIQPAKVSRYQAAREVSTVLKAARRMMSDFDVNDFEMLALRLDLERAQAMADRVAYGVPSA